MENENSPGAPAVAPIVKWAGGKRQLLASLIPLLPERHTAYCEPFLGGGALLFSLRPPVARVNDVNAELVNLYRVVQSDVEGLIADLRTHRNESSYFYAIRDWDRDRERYASLSPLKRASRILYLNKTCYNGLFRVNRAGGFNTPFGRYKSPRIADEGALRAVSAYLREADVRFSSGDYAGVLGSLPEGAFVYLDPPYFPVSETANFTGYAQGGFDRGEQVRLKEQCDALDRRGIRFMLSNSAAPFILDLYSQYNIDIVRARRAVNSVAAKRGCVDEVIVRNYQ